MKKIILGFILGLSFTSFAYVLMNPELPSMVGVTDITQIDLTKADEIISDPLQPGMTMTAADLNAKIHSLNMKIKKNACSILGKEYDESTKDCLVEPFTFRGLDGYVVNGQTLNNYATDGTNINSQTGSSLNVYYHTDGKCKLQLDNLDIYYDDYSQIITEENECLAVKTAYDSAAL